ncbi:probable LRR receptor-like serine/threonine-protein kinase At1g14390 [Primulina eburnea]|uniref:probable LRR receptor-like serine/threonine-protein kinase At1g14390 n=1 Tax=Primulina eburnea TaxID=1245227 RepID=UPI003C6C12E8
MENSWIHFRFLVSSLIFLLSFPVSNSQLAPTETRILLQIQLLLEYPPVLQQWNNWTNFCVLPPSPSLTITCSDNHVTELTVVGNRSSPFQIPQLSPSNFAVSDQTLSAKFSLDSFFTVLTKLSGLQRLSLVSLGLWGPLPPKINRFRSLVVLNISSNFIHGSIPGSVSTFQGLKSLVLSKNLLNGSVPDLSSLSVLENLDLSDNFLGPEFPSLGLNLVLISIANNSFRSEIPRDFNKMSRLQLLDASSNTLIGPIPSFLFSMPSIQHIELAKNQFTGALTADTSCGTNLTFVDISNNLLVGKLPSCLASNAGNKTVIIMFNCLSNTTSKYQRPSSFCRKDALAVQPPARSGRQESTLKLGIVLGIIGGVVGILVALGFLILVILKKAQRRRSVGKNRCDSFVIEKTSVRGSPIGRHVPQPMRMASLGLPPYHIFTLEEMEEATSNFDPSNLVVEGSQGQLYKGWLRDGSVVLVKCLKLKQKHSTQALQQHMETVVSKLRHRHLVSVLGHCTVTYQDHPNTASTVFIVLENIACGSLKDHISDWRKRDVMKWPERMALTLGIARGIQYLHTGDIHGNDLKIDNILLDETLTAKISSYNINLPSKVGAESPLNGQVNSNQLNSQNPEKEDIYQLGVILLQVIVGRTIDSQSEIDDLKFQLERSFAESPSKLRDMIDPSIRGTFAYESLKTMVQITLNCLCKDPSGRPTIEDVLWHMQYSVQVQEGWTNSGNLSGNLSGNVSTKL